MKFPWVWRVWGPVAIRMGVLHEGVARELRAIVGDNSAWHTKAADQCLEELDG